MKTGDSPKLAWLREQLPERAKLSWRTVVSQLAPLCPRYYCEVELDGRVVAIGSAFDEITAERCAINGYLALTHACGQPKGLQ